MTEPRSRDTQGHFVPSNQDEQPQPSPFHSHPLETTSTHQHPTTDSHISPTHQIEDTLGDLSCDESGIPFPLRKQEDSLGSKEPSNSPSPPERLPSPFKPLPPPP